MDNREPLAAEAAAAAAAAGGAAVSQLSSGCVGCARRCGKAGGGAEGEFANTAFRRVEKHYKLYQQTRREARRSDGPPPTDFTNVVDFHHLDRNTAANRAMIHRVAVDGPDTAPCYTFSGVPGLLIFPQVVSVTDQIALCREAVLSHGDSRLHPNILSTHAKEPRATTCYQPPMRWATLGFSYQWTSKTYDRSKFSSFPRHLKTTFESLMRRVAGVEQDAWRIPQPQCYEPQTAIVNYFPVGAMMMCHQDVSEECLAQPLVSLSLGCSAVFLMGTESRDDEPHALLLRSGDVVAFTGPARTAFHSTPRILDDCPAYLTLPDAEDEGVETGGGDGEGGQRLPLSPLTAEERRRYVNHAYTQHPTPDGSFSPVDKDAMGEAERERYWRLCMRHMRVNINARQVYGERCDFLFTD